MLIGSNEWSDSIIEGAAAFDVIVDRSHTRQFAHHARELIRWNQKFNITAITHPREIAIKHFLDSVLVAPYLPPTATVLDIGSGGGFPGLPLKVLLPSLKVTLIDASRKRVNFLKQVIRSLKLDHIQALHIRAEDLARESRHAGQYSVVTSRALSSLPLFCRLAAPLLADNGMVLALKGEVEDAELGIFDSESPVGADGRQRAAKRWTVKVDQYRLPVVDSRRSVVVLRETR